MSTVPWPRGGFGGLSPPQTKLQAPPNWKMKQYDSVQFLSIFECQALPHKRKAPRRKAKPSVENFLATVLHVNMAMSIWPGGVWKLFPY